MQADLRSVVTEVAEDAGEQTQPALDLLDVVDSLSNHYHEHLDAILGWSWRLFCARWARMLDAEGRRLVRERARREADDEAHERAALRQQLQQRGGGGSGGGSVDGW